MIGSDSPAITVAICTYNRYDCLPQAIASVLAQEVDRSEFRLLVVDNSDDEAARDTFYAAQAFDSAVEIVYSQPPGLAKARNLAIERSGTPYIAYLDDDAVAEPGWLAAVLAAFAESETVAIVAGPIAPIWPQDRPDWLPEALEPTLTILDYGDADFDVPSWGFAYGANMSFRTEVLRAAGGFGEQLGRKGSGTLLSCEEVECQDTMRRRGYALRYAARALVRHHVHPARLRRNWFRSRMAWQAVSEALEAPPRYDRAQTTRELARLAREIGIASAMQVLFREEGGIWLERQVAFVRHLVLMLLFAHQEGEGTLADLFERRGELSDREDVAPVIASRPGVGARRVPTLQRDDAAWERLNVLLSERDDEVVALSRTVVDRDARVAERDAQLAERDAQLAERDAQLALREAQLDDRDRQLSDRDAALAMRAAVLADRDAQLASANALIQTILNSRSWRLTRPLRYVARLWRYGMPGKRRQGAE